MKSLICSDIHDQIKNLEDALKLASTSNCNSIVCCGDLCSPFIIDIFGELCPLPVHIIFGNNDGDQFNILNKCNQYNANRNDQSKINIYGQFLLKAAGKELAGIPNEISMAVYHYPEPAKATFTGGLYNYVFYGHTHVASLEPTQEGLLANPGALMGYTPGKNRKFVPPSCLIIDWVTKEADLIEF